MCFDGLNLFVILQKKVLSKVCPERVCLVVKYHHYFMMCGNRLQYNELGRAYDTNNMTEEDSKCNGQKYENNTQVSLYYWER